MTETWSENVFFIGGCKGTKKMRMSRPIRCLLPAIGRLWVDLIDFYLWSSVRHKLLRKVSLWSIYFTVLKALNGRSTHRVGIIYGRYVWKMIWTTSRRHMAKTKCFPNIKNRPKNRLYTTGKRESERCLRLRASGQFSEKWNYTHIVCITRRETISECYPACTYIIYYFIMNTLHRAINPHLQYNINEQIHK